MKITRYFILIIALLTITGCASLLGSATQRMADNLSLAMLNQDDLEIAKAATPAYLIMIDSLIEGDPNNVSLLLSGAKLYGSYNSAFVGDDRAPVISTRNYAHPSVCGDCSQCHAGIL
ncbi:MAG: TRAP transporter TatT component family protein [Gammaproteobacteria bacterium]